MYLNKKNFSFFLLWLVLTSSAPFIFYLWPFHPHKILIFTGLVIFILMITKIPKLSKFDVGLLGVIFIQILYLTFCLVYRNDSSYINIVIQLVSLVITIQFILDHIGFSAFVKSYINIILIMGIGGVITFFVHYFVGIHPIFSVYYTDLKATHFLGLTSTNVFIDGDFRFMRFAGFFDEPGRYALFSILAIILNKVYFNNRRVELLLILVTIFSFSFAGYVNLIVYYLFFMLKKSNLKYFIVSLLIVFAAVFYLNTSNNPSLKLVKKYTIERFALDDSGQLSNNNRTEHEEYNKIIFQKYPLLGSTKKENKVRGSNLYAIIAEHGVIGSFFYYLFLVYMIIISLKLDRRIRFILIKIIMLILLNVYHRPELGGLLMNLIFVSIILHYKYYLKQINNSLLDKKRLQLN